MKTEEQVQTLTETLTYRLPDIPSQEDPTMENWLPIDRTSLNSTVLTISIGIDSVIATTAPLSNYFQLFKAEHRLQHAQVFWESILLFYTAEVI